MQPDFTAPDFIQNNTVNAIHRRMMNNLPTDIDDMPNGFAYDFTMPAALEKAEFINYHLLRAIMIAFPQYAWDEWLDLHGQQVHIKRHDAKKASGIVLVEGIAGTKIAAGTIFCTPATDTGPAVEFAADREAEINTEGTAEIPVTAVKAGKQANVLANTVSIMAKPIKGITRVTNPGVITGGTEREGNNDFYDRIAAEYDSSLTYVGNDSDYIRWAKEAGAGDCIVVPAHNGPGTVELVLVDANGQPANEKLVKAVYDYIVSPEERSKRLLPAACAELVCVPATTRTVSYVCTGIELAENMDMDGVKTAFAKAVKDVYAAAKMEGVLRYNDVRPTLGSIGIEDFDTFLMNGTQNNIVLKNEEYPETGEIDFKQEAAV